MPGDDAKRPFRTYRGRGGDAGDDPIEERARANAAAEAAEPAAEAPARPAVPPPIPPPAPAAPPPRGRPGVIVLPDEEPARAPGTPRPPGPPQPPSRRPPRRPRRRRRLRLRRLIGFMVLGALLMLVLWVGYGYSQFRGSLDDANKRIDEPTRATLTPGGSLLSEASTTLVLGSDRRPDGGSGRSDSILLVRVDPDRNRIARSRSRATCE